MRWCQLGRQRPGSSKTRNASWPGQAASQHRDEANSLVSETSHLLAPPRGAAKRVPANLDEPNGRGAFSRLLVQRADAVEGRLTLRWRAGRRKGGQVRFCAVLLIRWLAATTRRVRNSSARVQMGASRRRSRSNDVERLSAHLVGKAGNMRFRGPIGLWTASAIGHRCNWHRADPPSGSSRDSNPRSMRSAVSP